jgi:CheY-like chemotaxis protein
MRAFKTGQSASHWATSDTEEGAMERILVVDDERDVRDAIGLLLRREGFRVVVAECGHTAVSAIEAFTFDVVIVDIVMPGIGGLETISILRADAPDVSIIAMSGYAGGSGLAMESDFFRDAMERGATCCLAKPFTREQLLDAVEFCRLSKSLVA